MLFSRFTLYFVLVAASLAGVTGTGCSRRSETVAAPSGPPPTAQQRVEQIQNDPNVSEDIKRIRLQNARENSGPPVRR